jgi:hypothetical protein
MDSFFKAKKKPQPCFHFHLWKNWVGSYYKNDKILRFFFYLGYTGQGSDFNNACPKMAIKTLLYTLKIRVGKVSRNTGIYFVGLYLIIW